MTSLGHAVVDMDSRVPVFECVLLGGPSTDTSAGPFLQCPAHGAGTPIFGMTEWHFGFFHHGCFGCSAANTVCPLFGHVYHFVRLAYRGRMTVAWVPDTWLARVLCHAAIP
jgi:hypothetical protein